MAGKHTMIVLAPETTAFYRERFRSLRGGVIHVLKIMPAVIADANDRFSEAVRDGASASFVEALATRPFLPGEQTWKMVRRLAAEHLSEDILCRLEALPGATLEIAQMEALLQVHQKWPGDALAGDRIPVKLPVDLRRFYEKKFGHARDGRGCSILVEAFARWTALYGSSLEFQGLAARRLRVQGEIEQVASAAMQGREPLGELPPGAILVDALKQLAKHDRSLFLAKFDEAIPLLPASFLAVLELSGQIERPVVVSPKVSARTLDDLVRIAGGNRHAVAALACEAFLALAVQEYGSGDPRADLTPLEVEFIREALSREGEGLNGGVLGRPLIPRLERFCHLNGGPTAKKIERSTFFERLSKKTPMQLALLEIHCHRKNRAKEVA